MRALPLVGPSFPSLWRRRAGGVPVPPVSVDRLAPGARILKPLVSGTFAGWGGIVRGCSGPDCPGSRLSVRFDFRADLFNAFNHPIFQNPNGSIATANAGKVTDTASPRQIMLGLRYSF
jgi:hypothetical protein